MFVNTSFNNLGKRTNGATVAGNAWSIPVFEDTTTSPTRGRSGVLICHDPEGVGTAQFLYVTMLPRGSSIGSDGVPVASFAVRQRETIFIPASGRVDVYCRNSTGAATTSVVSVREIL